MKTYTRLFAVLAGAVGIIGIGESIVNFSLFQTMIGVGLVWLAFSINNDVTTETENENNPS